MTERVAGLRGRNHNPELAAQIPKLRDYHQDASGLFVPTYPVDVSGGITEWDMLGNGPDPTLTVNNGQPVGDCGYAGRQHYRMAGAAACHLVETWETTNRLVSEYLAYNHGQDIGVDLPTILLHWFTLNIIHGFAQVDITNPAEVDWAMQTYHGIYAGVSLTDDANDLFNQGKPWTTAQGQQPDPSEGHCIVKVKSTTKQDTWVTWGALQASTKGWTKACLDEAYVIITPEDATAASLNIKALRADLADFADAHGINGSNIVPKKGLLDHIKTWLCAFKP